MKRFTPWWILMVFMGFGTWAHAQPRTITVADFELQPDVVDSARGVTGMRISYTLEMNWLPPSGEQRRFSLSHRIDWAGEPVFYSSDLQYPDYQFFGQPSSDWNPVGMEMKLRHFIPYRNLSLPRGLHDLTWVASLETRDTVFRECIRVPFQLNFQPIERRKVSEQVFRFDNVWVSQREQLGDTGNVGMTIRADIYTQYPREAALDSSYKLFWMVKSMNGATLFDSRKAPKPEPTHGRIATPTLKTRCVKFDGFVDYFHLQMDGPDTANIEIWLDEGQGKSRKVYAEAHELDVSRKFNFEDQKFLKPALQTYTTTSDGRQALSVYLDVQFGLTGTLRNYQMGDYHFRLEVTDLAGKPVFAKDRAVNADQQWLGQAVVGKALDYTPNAKGRFVLPIHLLRLPEGLQSIVLTVKASDGKGLVKFPVVMRDTVQIQKPKDYGFSFTVEQLRVREMDYDLAFEPFTHGDPDLRYYLYIGDQKYFFSREAENSFSATVQTWKCWLSAGEVLTFEVMDLDWGAPPNRDDFIARYTLDCMDKGNLFYFNKANDGDIQNLRIRIQRL